ncbi:MAG: LamG domain-containing protein, partial [bacterium]|nr:LamG domain-containing protein [bacterium]
MNSKVFRDLAIIIIALGFFGVVGATLAGGLFSTTIVGIDDGLVAHYTFDGPDVNWATGTVTDTKGSNDGSMKGSMSTSTAPVTGRLGQGFKFDGVGDAVNIDGAITSLNSTTEGTWSMWVKPIDATPSSQKIPIVFNAGGTNTDRIEFLLRTDGNFDFQSTIGGGASLAWALRPDSPPFSDNTWTHLVGVQNGVEPKLYIDGVAVAQSFTTSVDKTIWFNDLTQNEAWIGERNVLAGEEGFFNGSLDDVRIYNRALSADEVNQLYQLGATTHIASGFEDTTDLFGHWTFDTGKVDFTNNLAFDETGENNGTL